MIPFIIGNTFPSGLVVHSQPSLFHLPLRTLSRRAEGNSTTEAGERADSNATTGKMSKYNDRIDTGGTGYEFSDQLWSVYGKPIGRNTDGGSVRHGWEEQSDWLGQQLDELIEKMRGNVVPFAEKDKKRVAKKKEG